MANNSVDITLTLRDKSNSVKQLTKETKALNKELERSQSLAGSLTTGTKTGATAAKKAGYSPTAENVAYGSARGSMGATGASARDFANQAQGLGGVVRLYATWAANIYAVGAAFSALKEAANVTNMVEGMNQLGVASGLALGSMAKKFAEASGGAVSLQEAISATVKATSSGLSAKQFDTLGQVANKASRALGINMSDAVSRLTRGITKLEPELLDELGIFTKVGQASEDYAKRIGKSANSLTDFEKRQAFANAVLKEGMDKFGNINVEANPYDKLTASIKNLTQTGLELVNKVFGPIINFLSSSPTALTGVMAGLGVMLLKQAIPAIGQYRQSLADTADFATKKWAARSEEMKKIEADKYKDIQALSELNADKSVAILDKAAARVIAIREKGLSSNITDEAKRILSITDYTQVTDKDRKYLRDTAKMAKDAGNLELAKAYKEANNALRAWITSEKEHLILQEQINKQAAESIKNASRFSAVGYARDKLEEARKASARTQLVSKATEDTSTVGAISAWKSLSEGIKAEKLSGLSAALTKVSGAAAIAAVSVTRVISVLSGFLGWIGAAVAVFTTIYSLFSKNTEASDKLTSSVDGLNTTYKTASSTFEKFSSTLNANSVEAVSNAMAGLSESVSSVIDDLLKFDKATSGIDRAWENLKGLFGMSQQDTASKAMSESIMSMLDNLSDPSIRSKFQTQLQGLLDVTEVNFNNLDNALESIDPKKLQKLKPILEQINVSAKVTSATIKAVSDSFKDVETAYNGLTNSLKQTDPISAFAEALAKQSSTLVEAFKDPTTAATTFAEIIKDNSKLAGFPPELQSSILSRAKDFDSLTASVKENQAKLALLNEEIVKLTGLQDTASQKKLFDKLSLDKNLNIDDLNLWSTLNKKFNLAFNTNELNNKLKATAQSFGSMASKELEYAFDVAMKKGSSAAALANIDREKSLVSYLPKSINTIEAASKLEQKAIDIRIQEITALYELANQLKISVVEAKIMEAKKAQAAADGSDKKLYASTIANLEKEKALYRDRNIGANLPKGTKIGEGTSQIASGTYEGLDGKLVFDQLMKQKGFSSQVSELMGQKANIALKAKMDKYVQGLDDEAKLRDDRLKSEKAAYDEQLLSEKYLSSTLEQRVQFENEYLERTKKDRLAQATQSQSAAVSTAEQIIKLSPGSEAAKAAEKDLNRSGGLKEQLDVATKIFETQDNAAVVAKNRADTEKIIAENIDKQLKPLERANSLSSASLEGAIQDLETKKQLMEAEIANSGFITDTQALALKQLDLEIIAKQKSVALSAEALRHEQAMIPIKAKLSAIEKGYKVTPEVQAELQAQLATEQQLNATRMENINKQYDGMTKLRDMRLEDGTRIKAYGDIFKQTFESMADAMVEFAKTGKLDFKSLIDSMLADLLRYELRLQYMKLFQSMGGSDGVGGFIAKIIGSVVSGGMTDTGTAGVSSTSAVSGSTSISGTSLGFLDQKAKGGAYALGGIEAFAKGGAFTNSIVNSPTLFKFAKGTGLMGEAGPEAIMPLKRDANGNLGVRAGNTQPNVTVTVVNNSSEKAETKETTDSRGNRNIEVIIGEMVAGELAKPNSAMQNTMKGTFGAAPMLTRR